MGAGNPAFPKTSQIVERDVESLRRHDEVPYIEEHSGRSALGRLPEPMLQARVKTLNREWAAVFKQWYPDMQVEDLHALLALWSEAREDAQPDDDRRVHVHEPCPGGIERPRERLLDDLQVEGRIEPGGDCGIVIHLDHVLMAET